jgi:hypothetical protein
MSLDPRVKEERGKLAAVIRKDVHRILTASQRAILIEMVNAWYAHRGFEGYIHPGKTRLAKRCGVSARTAKYALSRLRDLKFIVAVANLSGRNEHGANAPTYYTVSLRRIYMEMASARQVKAMLAAEEIGGRGAIFGYTGGNAFPPMGGQKLPPVYNTSEIENPWIGNIAQTSEALPFGEADFPSQEETGFKVEANTLTPELIQPGRVLSKGNLGEVVPTWARESAVVLPFVRRAS